MTFEVIDGVIVKYNGPDSVEAVSTDPIDNPIAIPEDATSIADGVIIPYNQNGYSICQF